MDLNNMCVFSKVAETKSITSASEQLGLSKQTISRKIIQLEESLGVSLIRRTTRSCELTAAGHAYFEQCLGIVQQALKANAMVKSLQDTPAGDIRLGVPHALSDGAISQLFSFFLAENPQVKMNFVITDRRTSLIDECIDLAFRIGPMIDSSLVGRGLGRITFACIASPEYFLRNKIPESLDELGEHTLIAMENCRMFEELGTDVKSGVRVRFSEYSMAKKMVLNGFGMAFLPIFMCQKELKARQLIAVTGDEFQVSKNLSLVYDRTKHQPVHLRELINYVIDCSRPKGPWEIHLDELIGEGEVETSDQYCALA